MNEEDKNLIIAKFVAALMVILVIGLMLFPWFVPFIWSLPKDLTVAYYGILMMMETKSAFKNFDNYRKDIT